MDVALLIADVPEYQTNPAERRLMTFPEAATLWTRPSFL
jgi:hypothetical protein